MEYAPMSLLVFACIQVPPPPRCRRRRRPLRLLPLLLLLPPTIWATSFTPFSGPDRCGTSFRTSCTPLQFDESYTERDQFPTTLLYARHLVGSHTSSPRHVCGHRSETSSTRQLGTVSDLQVSSLFGTGFRTDKQTLSKCLLSQPTYLLLFCSLWIIDPNHLIRVMPLSSARALLNALVSIKASTKCKATGRFLFVNFFFLQCPVKNPCNKVSSNYTSKTSICPVVFLRVG